VRRATSIEADARRAEVIDLSGVGREHLIDGVGGALSIPVATELHAIGFAPESYWRGEIHRLGDRPASLWRLVDELVAADVEQVILVSAVSDPMGPHTLAPPRMDGRGRLGEYLQSSERAVVSDVISHAVGSIQVFPINPAYNPIGPLDFAGGFDDRSDRRLPLRELVARGYEDAYRQFIEPVLGASGEQVGGQSLVPTP
jgi:hypothetical protein